MKKGTFQERVRTPEWNPLRGYDDEQETKLESNSRYGKRDVVRPVQKPFKRSRCAWVYGIGWVVRDARTGVAWY